MKRIALICLSCCAWFASNGQVNNIHEVEYFFNADPGFGGGTDVPITPAETITDLSFDVDLSTLTPGFNTLNIRARNDTGWCVAAVKPIYVVAAASLVAPNITALEFFIDDDPGMGAGTGVAITPGTTITDLAFDIPTSSLTAGFHTLTIRAKDENETWSVGFVKSFFVFSSSSLTAPNLVKLEYFVDYDPGFGGGIDIPITAGSTITDLVFEIDTETLTSGFHTLAIRAQDENGTWGPAFIKPIYILSAAAITLPDLDKVEYFIDNDPGYGAGVDIPITTGITVADHPFTIPLDTLSTGFHVLNVRARDVNGVWSAAYTKAFFMLGTGDFDISKLEYFVDADPGYGAGIDIPITAGSVVTDQTFDVAMDTLSAGFHTLNVRARDNSGVWGAAYVKSIFVLGSGNADVTKLEYFFDADPGYGAAIDVPITTGSSVDNLSIGLVMDTLSHGFHTLNIRAQNAEGMWSTAYNKAIFVSQADTASLGALEYFFDIDPGVGNGTAIPLAPVIVLDSLVVGALISALPVGPHRLYIRARDSNGRWSTTESYPFEACIQDEPAVGQALGLSYDTFIANWAAAEDALTYQLDVSTDTLRTFLPGFASKTLTELRDTLINLIPLTHYQYRVRALGNDNCLSINSDTIYVRTNSTLIIDTEALVALYNQAGGANWTNNSGWLSSGLADNTWHGVTVVNENVVAVDLSDNNLNGAVPDSVLNISLLQSLNLTGNRVNYVPDFSGLVNIDTINISDNSLDFGDLEYNLDVTGINFADQKDIGFVDTDTVNVSNPYTHLVIAGGSANQYVWRKNNVALDGGTNSDYVIPAFAKNDQGVYQCIITSPLIPALTLRSAPKTLVGVATVSGTLMANGNPVSEGTVQLLRVTEGGYDSIPATPLPVNANGTFTFNNILLESYLLVGLADTVTYERALPTYVPSTAYWEEADTIELVENISNLQIATIFEPEDQLTGEGLLFGLVQEDDGLGGRSKATKRVGGAGVSARRTQGTGKGKEVLEIVGYVFTNDDGEFSIAGLPPGEYRFNVQYPGYPMDETTFIDFTIGSSPLEEEVRVEATVESGVIKVAELIITGIFERADYKADVFPNPSRGSVHVQFAMTDETRRLIVKDATGKVVREMYAPELEHALSFENVEPGIYMMSVTTRHGTQRVVKVVKN